MKQQRTVHAIDGYYPRIADALLKDKLRHSGAVQIKGPKWCGKTATAQQIAASSVYLQDPDQSSSLLALAEVKPSAILEGPKPRLIDEWQMAPQLWDAVRFSIDQTHGRGMFILTGSSTPRENEKPKHSGVGRISRLTMHTMSLYETGESSGTVSLRALFEGERDIASLVDFDIDDIAYAVCRGGWPEAVLESDKEAALSMAREYIDELLDSDISEMDDTSYNRTWMRSILQSYARNISTEAPLSTIAADMKGEAPSPETVSKYIDALRRACVIDDIEAWNPRVRSKTPVRTSPTRHLSDPSLACALLGMTPRTLLLDFNTFGLLFESLCVHDLRIYAEALHGSVRHYRDKSDLEADAVIVLDDGRWGLIEVKLGGSAVETAATHLKRIADRVDVDHEGKPSFLLVLTGTNASYCRDDGVLVAPLTSLAP